MPYPLNNDQLKRTFELDNEQRLKHFFETVADWEELWAIGDDQGWVIQAKGEQPYLSLWPHPKFAEDIIRRLLPKHECLEVDFEFLLDQLLPTLKQESIYIAVFPNIRWEGVLMSPDDFEQQLREAMKAFE